MTRVQSSSRVLLAVGMAVLAGCGGGHSTHDAASPSGDSGGGSAGAAGTSPSDAAGAGGGAVDAGSEAPETIPDAPADTTATDARDAPAGPDGPSADGPSADAADAADGQPTFPGVVASPLSESLQVADFFLASDEKTIATTYNPVALDELCDTAPINLLHDDGQQFQLVREAVGYSHWHDASFSDDGAFIAATDGAGTGCTQPDNFVSMRADGTGKVSRLAVTSGSRQKLLGIFGTTALNLDWKPPGSTIAPDAYVLRDLAAPGGPMPASFGKMPPVPDPTGRVTVWGSSTGVVLSPLDKSNPVPLAPGATSCRHVWSADGKTLAFRWGSGDCFTTEATLSLIDRDGSHLREAGTSTLSNPAPVFSPDGQTLAWSAHDGGGQRTIVMRGIAGQTAVVVPAPGVATEQSWDLARMWFSPLGKFLIVEVESNAYLVAATGGTFKKAGAVFGTFSPDETFYASRSFATGRESYLAKTTDASPPALLSSSSLVAPVFAPAAGVRRIVFTDNWDSGKGEADLVLADLDGGNRQVVTRLTGTGDYPLKGSFLPRARRWTFAQWFGDVFVYSGPIKKLSDQPYDLIAVSADGKTKGVLAPDVLLFGSVERNPRSLFFVRRMPNSDRRLWRVTLPGR